VVEINSRLDGEPALVNSDPYGSGWMIRLRPEDAGAVDGLMDAAAYGSHIG
jgi:glycine cleavage system H protein